MALIKCSECGKEISDKATSCIHCGCPIEKPKRTVKIIKTGALLLRCSILIDNQPIGAIGTGTGRDNIKLELPIGTHNISVITQVKHGDFYSATAISQEQDGKQFEITESDEVIIIKILTKGSFTGSTGRCVIGNIEKYTESEYNTLISNRNKNLEIEKQKNKRYLHLWICGIIFMLLGFCLGIQKNTSDFTDFIIFSLLIIGLGCLIYPTIKLVFKS